MLTTVQEKEKIGRMLVLCSVDSCGEKRLRCERSASFYLWRVVLPFLCMMLAKAARSPEAIASLSVCGVAAAKFLGPRPTNLGDDVPVEAQQADLSTFCAVPACC